MIGCVADFAREYYPVLNEITQKGSGGSCSDMLRCGFFMGVLSNFKRGRPERIGGASSGG